MLALTPCSAQKRRSQKAFFTLCKVPSRVLLAFGVRRDWCLQQPPPSFVSVSHLTPTCSSGSHQMLEGWGRASPEVVLEQLPQQDTGAGYGLQRRGSLQKHLPVQSLWAHAVKTLVQDAREDCRTQWCATWEEGKVCL